MSTQTAAQALQIVTQELSTPVKTLKPLTAKFAGWLAFKTFGDPDLIRVATAAQGWATAFRCASSNGQDARSGVLKTNGIECRIRPRWLSLIGSSGTGKTYVCRKLWDYAKRNSDWSKCEYFPKIIFWPDFVQQLRAGNSYEMRQEMKRWPVLFLDDIGAERDPSGFAAEELNTLLGCRVDKWTLITSNKDAEGLRAIDGRILSRMIRDENVCISINCPDFATR